MAESPLDALARRLDRLERQTRHWKTAAAILAALPGTAGALGVAAPAPASLSLHTRTGNASMSIVQETGRPDPRLRGTSQLVERASLTLDRGVARLMLNDSAGTARSVLDDTGLRLVVPDVTEGRPATSVVLFDESGTVLWKAP